MKSIRKSMQNKRFKTATTVAIGTIVALGFSLVAIFLFAFAIKLFHIEDGAIPIVNQIIKILSVLLGIFIAMRTDWQQGWLKGLLTGACYMIVCYLLFGLLDGGIVLQGSFITDILMSAIVGGVGGVLLVNFKSK